MFIVLLGAPGSGKGTVSEILTKDLNLVHISTGDLFRENLKNETELGKKIKKYMDNGELVPDDITIKMLEERLNKPDISNGAILDGFPRTYNQAKVLDHMLGKMGKKVNMALNIDVPFDEIIERILNRISCVECKKIYNIKFNPPRQEGVCDVCGGKLYKRNDQTPEIIQNRLEIYKNTSHELLTYYEKEGLLYTVKAGISIGKDSTKVANEVEEFLKSTDNIK